MTASRSDSPLRRLALVVLAALPACRAGLPPDPPHADPMNASADIPPYRPPANPYETSAFAGTPAPAASGHEGHGSMNHGAGHEHMGHTMSPAPAATPTPAAGHEQMDHSAHTPTPAKPAPVDHSAHTGKASPTPETRR